MSSRKVFTVIVDHAHSPELRGQHTFVCHQDSNGTWFANAPLFGCSKNYRTPEIAIAEMVADHAGTILSIKERN